MPTRPVRQHPRLQGLQGKLIGCDKGWLCVFWLVAVHLILSAFIAADLSCRHILWWDCIFLQSLPTGLLCTIWQQHLQPVVGLLPALVNYVFSCGNMHLLIETRQSTLFIYLLSCTSLCALPHSACVQQGWIVHQSQQGSHLRPVS